MIHKKHIELFCSFKRSFRNILFVAFMFCIFLPDSFSQKTLIFQIENEKPRYKKFNDSTQLNLFVVNKQLALNQKGYINTFTDTIRQNSDSIFIRYNLNKKYYWNSVKIKNQEYISTRAIQKFYALEKKPVSWNELLNLKKQTINQLENNGYPFAQIKADSNEINENGIDLSLEIIPNKIIRFDSLKYNRKIRTSPLFLSNYLRIKHFEPYNEKAVKNIEINLSKLKFISINSPFELEFYENKARISLDLKEKKANQFNGIIGFQPAQDDNTLQFTGQFYLKVLNTFRIGETLEFEWNKLEQNSQELFANATFPYIFLGNFGVRGNLHIEKFDTTYVSTKTALSITYSLTPSVSIRANTKIHHSNLLVDFNTNDYAEFSAKFLGMGFTANLLDNEVSPQKGYKFNFDMNSGNKEFADSTKKLRSNEWLSDFKIYKSIFRTFTTSYAYKFGIIDNSQISTNEMFKLGGIKTIRGFNEKSITTPSFLIQSTEIAYYLESNSRVFVFYDFGITDIIKKTAPKENYLHALGTGIVVETKAGLFSLAYALGKINNNNFKFKDAKIHFGYISQF